MGLSATIRMMLVQRHDVPAPGFTLTHGRTPRLKSEKLRVQFRNGYVDRKHTYEVEQLRWGDTGDDWDVAAVARA